MTSRTVSSCAAVASSQLKNVLLTKSRPFGSLPIKVNQISNSPIASSKLNCTWKTSNQPSGFHHVPVGVNNVFRFHTSPIFKQNLTCSNCSHSYPKNSSDIINLVLCPKCGSLQGANSVDFPNYFDILGQKKSYRVDLRSITNRSKQLQKKFHPDLYSQKSPDQQSLSQEYSSLINKALWTLSDPIARGRYMLAISGAFSEDPDSVIERAMTSDPEFLEEVMELNEKLEEILSEKDWLNFRNQNSETMKDIHEELEKAFDKGDTKEAQRLLGRLKYYDTLQHKLKDLQSRIGVVE